ncbi:MAG: c-type cytochrome [Gemmatimonadales bacterium]
MRSKIAGVWKVGVLASGLSLLLTPLARVTAQQPAQNEVNEGARVYGATCGRCHNPRSPLERDDRDWIAIANHMRVRANLTGKEVRSVIAFLQATNTDPRERMPLGPEQRGPAPGRVPEVSTGPASEDRGMIERGETLTSQRA